MSKQTIDNVLKDLQLKSSKHDSAKIGKYMSYIGSYCKFLNNLEDSSVKSSVKRMIHYDIKCRILKTTLENEKLRTYILNYMKSFFQ